MTYRPSPPGATVNDLVAVSTPLQGSDLAVVRRSNVDYKVALTDVAAFVQAGPTISDLTDISTLQSSDIAVVRRGSTDYKFTLAELTAYLQANLSFGSGGLAAPTITSAAAGSPGTTSVPLTWTEGGGTVASRTVQLRTPSGSGSYSSATTSSLTSGAATVTGLSAGTAYDFLVTVTNTTGSNSTTISNVSTTGSLAAPTIASLAHGTVTTTTIPLTWTEGGGAVASRTVEIKTPTGGGSYASATTTGLGSGSATITGLTANTSYDVRVTLTNTTGSNNAVLTNTTTAATLAAPTIASLAHGTVTTTTIPLTWTEGGGTVASRTIEVKTPTGGGSYATASTSGVSSGAATITGLTSSTSYDARVTLTNATGSNNAVLTNTTTAAGSSNFATLTTAPLAWWDASGSNVFQDLAKSTPATANNDPVGCIANGVSNGTKDLKFQGSDSTIRPKLNTSGIGSHKAVMGTNQYGFLGIDSSTDTWMTALTGDMTFYFVSSGAFNITNYFTGPDFNLFGGTDFTRLAYLDGATDWDYSPGSFPVCVVVARIKASDKTLTFKQNNNAEQTGVFTSTQSALTHLAITLEDTPQKFGEFGISTAYESNTVRDNLIAAGLAKWS